MSWNVNMTGRPEKIVEALRAEAEKMGSPGSQSREEYEAALPHLVGLVEQNIAGVPSNPEYPKMISINASGHGSKGKDGVWTDRNCSVSISFNYTRFLV